MTVPRRGLRFRFVVTFASVAAVTAWSVAAVGYLLVSRSRVDEAAEHALEQAEAALDLAARTLPESPSVDDLTGLAAALESRHAFDLVLAADGVEPVQTSISLPAEAVPADLAAIVDRDRLGTVRARIGSTPYVVVGGTVLPEGPDVYLFFDQTALEGDLAALRQTLIFVAVGAVMISGVVGAAAAGGILRPVRRARDAARRLARGELATRLPVNGRDELSELSASLNAMAAALQGHIGELARMEAEQRRFVADVSHELRTPLTALVAAADVLERERDGLGARGVRAATILTSEVQRLAVLVEDLMEISRIDAGRAMVEPETTNLRQAVEASVEMRGWTALVRVDCRADVHVEVDRRRLDAIVANLVGNGLAHGAPPVEVTIDRFGVSAVVEVSDHGAGVPSDHVERIFERFAKADSVRPRSEGSGLGLAIARENAILNGGTLELSCPAGPTTFRLVLPLACHDDAVPAVTAETTQTVQAPRSLP